MTDAPTMTHAPTTTDGDDRRRRLEALQQRRGATPPAAATPTATPTGRRAHPALGARIGVAGIGTTTMLGLVAIMGVAEQGGTEVGAASSATAAAAPTAASPAPMVVVIRRPAPAGEPTATTVDPATADVGAANRGPDPVVLTARPSVRVVAAPAAQPAASSQAAAVPEARTNGSR